MILGYAKNRCDVKVMLIDTAARGRTIYNKNYLLRITQGVVRLLCEVMQFVLCLMRKKPDVVHLTASGDLSIVRDFAISILAKIFHVRFVYHIRFGRIPEIAAANTIEWRLIASVMRMSSFVIAIDEVTFSSIKYFSSDVNVMLIPNCVDHNLLPKVREQKSKDKFVLFIGWVVPGKGISELVEAWSIVNLSGWTLRIIGPSDPKYRAQLLSRFQPNNCEFLGELTHEDAMVHMAACDLFVLPSHSEGFPNVIVEAMALKRPILATTVGAIPQMLDDGAGMLVEPNSVDSLVLALNAVTQDTKMRMHMAELAYSKAMRLYTIDVVFKSYMGVWRNFPSQT